MPVQIGLLLIGVLAASGSVIFIKASTIDPILLASYRQLLAALLLAPVFVRELRRHKLKLSPRLIAPSVLPGLVLGIHFASWTIGARLTAAVNSTLIVNLVPIVMPFFVFFLLREKPNRVEVIGTIVAMAGMALLGFFDFRFDPTYFSGDAITFGSMLFFGLYLALGRRLNVHKSIWIYLVPLYLVGGLLCLAVGSVTTNPFTASYSMADLVAVAGLAVVSTIVGHSILNHAMRVLRPQLTSLVNLGQFVFAGVLGYLVLGEIPSVGFYLSSILVVAGAVIVILFAEQVRLPEGG